MTELAEKVGLSPTPAWKRVRKMEQASVTARRVALSESEQVGIGLVVFVAIKAHEHSPEWLAGFVGSSVTTPEVMDADRLAGDVNYMLRVAVGGMAEFDAFYKRLVAAVALKSATLRFAMKRSKRTTDFPLSSRMFPDRQDGDASL
jgi:Lrp/AsnC family transcriptional regulator